MMNNTDAVLVLMGLYSKKVAHKIQVHLLIWTHSFIQHLSVVPHCAPGPVQGAGDTVWAKAGQAPAFPELTANEKDACNSKMATAVKDTHWLLRWRMTK